MDLNELNGIFNGTDFFYHDVYCGVVRFISYDMRSNSYLVTFYNKIEPYIIPNNYMLEYYTERLKKLRMVFLKNRDIQRLVHFTKLSNLESILQNGFLSRDFLELLSYDYSYSDDVRLDNKLDYISSSITFPNYKMFYPKRMEDTSIKWVVLSLDSEVLVNRFDAEFYRMNAASSDFSKCRFNPCSNEALADMFYPQDRDLDLPVNYTTNPQAEVMIKDTISASYIKCIDTLGFDEKANWLADNSHIDYNPSSKLFTYRKDYKRW